MFSGIWRGLHDQARAEEPSLPPLPQEVFTILTAGIEELIRDCLRTRAPKPCPNWPTRSCEPSSPSSGRPGLLIGLVAAEAREPLPQVATSLQRHDDRDCGERPAGDHQHQRPEQQPEVHRALRSAGDVRLSSDPTTRPHSASPNAAKPVMFSFQCRKKNGTIAPAAPMNMAK